jgi:hypothetical protein
MLTPECQMMQIMNLQAEISEIRNLLDEALNGKKPCPAKVAAAAAASNDMAAPAPKITVSVNGRKISGGQADAEEEHQPTLAGQVDAESMSESELEAMSESELESGSESDDLERDEILSEVDQEDDDM